MVAVRSLWYRGSLADAAQWIRPAVRLLLLLTSVLILVMPLTESLWNWDHFLRGGSDVEFTLLSTLLFAGLVLLAIERSLTQPIAALLLHTLLALREFVVLLRDGLRTWQLKSGSAAESQGGIFALARRARPAVAGTHVTTPLRI